MPKLKCPYCGSTMIDHLPTGHYKCSNCLSFSIPKCLPEDKNSWVKSTKFKMQETMRSR